MPAERESTDAGAVRPDGARSPYEAHRCRVCGGSRVHYAFSIRGHRVLQCAECNFTARASPEPGVDSPQGNAMAAALVAGLGGGEAIVRQILPDESRPVRMLGWGGEPPPPDAGDAVVHLSIGQLDALAHPLPTLEHLRKVTGHAATVVFVVSDLRCTALEPGSPAWLRVMADRRAFHDTRTALTVLHRAGFRCRGVRRLRRRVTIAEALGDASGTFALGRWTRLALRLVPSPLRRRVSIEAALGQVAIAASPRGHERPLVSVIVPVYNEARTVAQILDAVLAVRLDEADLEVIVVESGSTDGSREIVQRYAAVPRVTCVFEERPRGKGHATRAGLAKARGDVILIQDADLEYDIEDYHALIEPILRGREAFVLGSRHGGKNHWKLRQFGKPLLSKFYNVAHVLVTAYINGLFGLRLRDPQTMYKVCRRDCIEGVTFRANYFDFDYEFLLKIARRGYRPVEVPVNYRSRSHAEGKKLFLWRDAPLGLAMITRLRFTRLRSFLGIGDPID